ncbi:saccharopine dehydrogenase NADP-binding domain-containing protein [Spirosoma sp.]|uniref:saccharopine dehydrogenase NADP-binding domain-containing protein n=1 Tax=Spirosoma sp. TaxID=1899569 RepID=UPI003B3BC730
MKKFAFLVHLGSSHRTGFRLLSTPLGWIPDAVYRFALRHRPLAPCIWSDLTLTHNVTEPEGHIIVLPYTSQQLMEQPDAFLPHLEEALALATSKGVEILGMDALISRITQAGKRIAQNPYLSITNGHVFTGVMLWQRTAQLIRECHNPKPVIAIVGATGSVGILVSTLLSHHQNEVRYLLIDRNNHQLHQVAASLRTSNASVDVMVSQQPDLLQKADIVILAGTPDYTLQAHHLKVGAIILNDTPFNATSQSTFAKRPDVTIIDGGLVATPTLRFLQRSVGLPDSVSHAALAETLLLAVAHHSSHFGIGTPVLEQVDYIQTLAYRFPQLGFGLAPDHSFGKPILRRAVVARQSSARPKLRFIPDTSLPSVSRSKPIGCY